MCHAITQQLIHHDLPGFASTVPQQTLEEAFRSCPITAGLQIYINYLTTLIHRSPKIMLLAIDLDEDFIDVEGIAAALMLSFQTAGIDGSELDTPESD
jgi:hypothetical protein